MTFGKSLPMIFQESMGKEFQRIVYYSKLTKSINGFNNDFYPFLCRLSIWGKVLTYTPTLAKNLLLLHFPGKFFPVSAEVTILQRLMM